ncbi:hypothetical protein PsorP6_010435 [Peronosclerospora sorghi]|uniref:Uncharacterized protein n=1 Tax=Peronosclerospora sorghi TaxID=230839 RepID=A0ACC0VUQ2_9STRA|nr:hypothetical protein PsorP6_010435 [Peronosclerospora sorghi]
MRTATLVNWKICELAFTIPILREHEWAFSESELVNLTILSTLLFFLSPAYKKLTISRKYSLNQLVREILLLARAWGSGKTDAAQLSKETISYSNGDPLFHNISASTDARTDWQLFTDHAPALCRFAVVVFAILPQTAANERLFIALGLPRQYARMAPGTLSTTRHMRAKLHG